MSHRSLPSKSTRQPHSSPGSSRFMAGPEQRPCGATLTSNFRSCAENGQRSLAASRSIKWNPSSLASRIDSQRVTTITSGPTSRECYRFSRQISHQQPTKFSRVAFRSLSGAKSSAEQLEKSQAKPQWQSCAAVPASSKTGRATEDKAMTLQQIAQEWLDAQKMRQEARELSNKSLTKKFECSRGAIARIANCMPCRVPEEDQILIRQCIAERDRLKSLASKSTIVGLCRRHKIGRERFISTLIEMGEWEDAA